MLLSSTVFPAARRRNKNDDFRAPLFADEVHRVPVWS
jgi:hypothetical protein